MITTTMSISHTFPRMVLIFCCLAGTGPAVAADGPAIVPAPARAQAGEGFLTLTDKCRVVAADGTFVAPARVLAEEIKLATGLAVGTAGDAGGRGDIVLQQDKGLKAEAYTLKITTDRAVITAGNCRGIACGSASLLQILTSAGGKAALPCLSIDDRPAAEYRGLMIDVARRLNTIDELKQCVVLCRLYKINYLHLHLTDDHAWTFPSTRFPKLGSSNNGYDGPAPQVYKLEDLRELVSFADDRGVTLIPEVDVPGHTDALRIPYPEVFDANEGPAHMGILNMASEKAYDGLDTLIGEILGVFKSSPYFHFGADEPRLDRCEVAKSYKPYLEKHNLKDSHELYLHFIVQMDKIVKKHGRRSMIWADFGGSSTKDIVVPRDVVAIAWQNGSGAGPELAKQGYSVINATWNPLYVVNQTTGTVDKVEDADGKHRPETIYKWNMFQFDNTKIEPTPKVIGAQICAWEEGGEVQVAALRSRIPALSERTWNPGAGRSFEDFSRRYQAVNPLLDKLIAPFRPGR